MRARLHWPRLRHIARSTLIVMVFFTLDKALAFLRAVIIVRQFGLSPELDAFNVANNLPDLLFALISGGAMSMALIPVLSEYRTKEGREALWRIFSRVANIAFLVTAGLAVLIAIFAEDIVSARLGIAPGFTPQKRALVAELMRLNLIATLIFSLSGLVMGSLQANQHFLLPAMAPLFYNLGQITGALVFAPQTPYTFGGLRLPALGMGVQGLVYGVILGAGLHLAIQIPGLIKYRFHWTPDLRIDEGVRKVGVLIGPRLLTMLAIQAIFWARDSLASHLGGDGAVTILTYGWMIMQVPETLIGTAIATVLLPTLSEQAALADWEAFHHTLEKALRVLLALALPVTVILMAGLRPLVAAVFHLDAAGTDMLTWTTRVYLLGLTGHVLLELGVRAFYARQDAVRPLIASWLNTALFLAFGVLVIARWRELGAAGIALIAMSFTAEALIVLAWLNRLLPDRLRVGWALPRAILAAGLGGVATWLTISHAPLSPFWAALSGMTLGALAALPLVWREIRALLNL